jgi:hypothetical protein
MVSHKNTCLAFEFNLEPPNHLDQKSESPTSFDESSHIAVVSNAPRRYGRQPLILIGRNPIIQAYYD